jgi:hypothetical protein
VTVSLTAFQTRALLLDIEGVTTPIEFVYGVLFPFARAHAAAYLLQEGELEERRAALDTLLEEQALDRDRGEHPPAPILDYAIWLMERDRKSPGLKALQGLIWREGFKTGALRGQVYPDVPLDPKRPRAATWRSSGGSACPRSRFCLCPMWSRSSTRRKRSACTQRSACVAIVCKRRRIRTLSFGHSTRLRDESSAARRPSRDIVSARASD